MDKDWVAKKVEALESLEGNWAWNEYKELVQYIQALYSSQLFSRRFMQLEPYEKDKEHRAIILTLNVLNHLLEPAKWLAKRQWSTWDQWAKLMEDRE